MHLSFVLTDVRVSKMRVVSSEEHGQRGMMRKGKVRWSTISCVLRISVLRATASLLTRGVSSNWITRPLAGRRTDGGSCRMHRNWRARSRQREHCLGSLLELSLHLALVRVALNWRHLTARRLPAKWRPLPDNWIFETFFLDSSLSLSAPSLFNLLASVICSIIWDHF